MGHPQHIIDKMDLALARAAAETPHTMRDTRILFDRPSETTELQCDNCERLVQIGPDGHKVIRKGNMYATHSYCGTTFSGLTCKVNTEVIE